MEIITKAELAVRKAEIIQKIKNGAVFIYPTDTIYGLGCNAFNAESVRLIRGLKNRVKSPFSICVPSKKWIRQNCAITLREEEWLRKLPGAYTLILLLKKEHTMLPEVMGNVQTIGIRLLKHWFQDVVKECGFPLITTSVNKHGEPFMTKLDNLDADLQKEVEFLIYEGEKESRPSTLIDIQTEEVIERNISKPQLSSEL